MRTRIGGVLVAAVLAGAPLCSAGSAASATTTVPLDCNDASNLSITLAAGLPNGAPQGHTFPFDVSASGFNIGPLAVDLTFIFRERFSVSSGVTPSGVITLYSPERDFDAGEVITRVGTLYAEFVASGALGTRINFRLLDFGYEFFRSISPTHFGVTCVPTNRNPVVATTTVTTPIDDTVAPTCVLSSRSTTGISVTARDVNSGIKSIDVTTSTNAQVGIQSFTAGTTIPVVVDARKITPDQPSQVALRVTDVKGNVTNCDPIVTTVMHGSRPQVFEGVSGSEHFVSVTNGDPGLKRIEVTVGTQHYLCKLRPDESTTINLRSMRASQTYTVKLRGGGKGSADVLIWDGNGTAS
jgi:hypothetical protein